MGLLQDIGVEKTTGCSIVCDNKTTMRITANPIYHERTRNIENDCRIIRKMFNRELHEPSLYKHSKLTSKFTQKSTN